MIILNGSLSVLGSLVNYGGRAQELAPLVAIEHAHFHLANFDEELLQINIGHAVLIDVSDLQLPVRQNNRLNLLWLLLFLNVAMSHDLVLFNLIESSLFLVMLVVICEPAPLFLFLKLIRFIRPIRPIRSFRPIRFTRPLRFLLPLCNHVASLFYLRRLILLPLRLVLLDELIK